MRKIYQKAGDGQCFTACVASILEVRLSDVPPITIDDVPNSAPYYGRVRAFLRRRGFTMMCFPGPPEIYAGATYIVTGNSPRRTEGGHSVVMFGRKMIHDPHRSGRGILSHDWTWLILPNFPKLGAHPTLPLYATS